MTEPELADALQAPLLARRIADLIDRYAADLRLGSEWRLAAAARILADPQIAAGQAAEHTLAQLRARHQPRPGAPGSPTVVCSCGAGAYDACEDARLLNGPPC